MKKLIFGLILATFTGLGVAHAQSGPGPSNLPGCVYNTTPPTLSDRQQTVVQCDNNGQLKISGAISAETTAVATAANPTYSEGVAEPLSQDLSGNLRTAVTITPSGTQDINITEVGGNAVTTTVPVSGTVTANQGTSPWIVGDGSGALNVIVDSGTLTAVTSITNPVAVTGTFWQATQPISAASLPLPTGASTSANQVAAQAPVAPNTATATASVLTGAMYNSTLPTFTDGQQGAIQVGARGAVVSSLYATNSNVSLSSTATGDTTSAPSGLLVVKDFPYIYNGSNYDRVRGVATVTDSVGTGISASGMLAQHDDVSPTPMTEGNFGNLRISDNRNLYGTIRDAAGNERGANVTAGNALVVDGSASTQPISGTVTATQATGSNLHVVCDSGCAGSGGTSSSFGATFPATGTAGGMSDGANMVPFTTTDGTALDVNCTVGCAGGSFNNNADNVATSSTNGQAAAWPYVWDGSAWDRLYGDSTNGAFVNVKTSVLPTGAATAAGLSTINTTLGSPFQAGGSIGNTSFAVTQGTAANLNATVVGTGTFVTQSTLAAETTKVIGTVRNLGNAGAIIDGVNTAATAPANGILGLGIYNSTEPSPTTGQSVGIQLDSKGRTRGVIMDAAGNTRGANVTAGNALLVDASATTQPVSYATTGSGNATGALRVELANNGTGAMATVGTVTTLTGTTTLTPGTAAANLGKAEDAALASGDTGVMALAVQIAAPADSAADNDYSPLQMKNGALFNSTVANTVGGTSLHTKTLAASTNATNVKASAGSLYSISGFNMSSATPVWISLYNNSGTPTCGTSIIQQFLIPGSTTGSGFVYNLDPPKAFATGIAYCATTGIAGTGNPAASTYVLNIDYK